MPIKPKAKQNIDEAPYRKTPRATPVTGRTPAISYPKTVLPPPPTGRVNPAPPGHPQSDLMRANANRAAFYVPPGTNDMWWRGNYEHPGQELQELAYAQSIQPPAPTVIYYGGGGGGGTGEAGEPAPVPITWSEKYQLPGSPGFWKGMMPSQWTPETEFAAMANALIPYLSPEDQRSMSSNLSRLFPDAFGNYSPEKTQFPEPQAPGIAPATSTYFQSAQRASDILSALDKMKEVSGQEESKFGPGYQYLRHLATTMKDFGAAPGAQNMSRRQMVNMFGALDPLLAESKGQQLGAYEGVAKSLTQPFFTAAQLLNVGKDESGNWVFGKANKSWF